MNTTIGSNGDFAGEDPTVAIIDVASPATLQMLAETEIDGVGGGECVGGFF